MRGAFVSGPAVAGLYNPAIASPTSVWADLPADPSSAGEARRLVRTTLEGWRLDDLVESATLLVSELVANSVLHAGTTIRVLVRRANGRVRVEVHDGNERAPARKHYSTLSTTGRGLLLVERMASDWGVEPSAGGKYVWFELDPGEDVADRASQVLLGALDDEDDEMDPVDRSLPRPFRDNTGPRAQVRTGMW